MERAVAIRDMGTFYFCLALGIQALPFIVFFYVKKLRNSQQASQPSKPAAAAPGHQGRAFRCCGERG